MNPENPEEAGYRMRDIHGDTDSAIINRINQQNEWRKLQQKMKVALEKLELTGITSMTVNERLYAAGLMNEFEKYKKSDRRFAQFILEELKVDRASIEKILP